MRRTALMGVLLFAASLFSQQPFHLTETKAQIAALMGPPKSVSAISNDLESWQFEAEEMDEGEFSHYFIFRKSTGRVEGITRNFNPPRNVDSMFPSSRTQAIELAPGYRARAHRTPEGAWLLAVGSPNAGEPAAQIVLMKEAVLRAFYPVLKLPAL